MQSLATALVNAATFLTLSGEEVIDPQLALRALQTMAQDLQGCSPEERRALRDAVVAARARHVAAGRPVEELAFFDSFLEALGLQPG